LVLDDKEDLVPDDKEDKEEVVKLLERVRARLAQEGESEHDSCEWIPDCHLPADTLPQLAAPAQAQQGAAARAATGDRQHPSRVQGGFAAMRMTQQQICEHVLQTTSDNPACERACRAIQEKLWLEPAIRLEGQLPVGWGDYEKECDAAHLKSTESLCVQHKVFALLQQVNKSTHRYGYANVFAFFY
jgi:hypothetical protein